MIRKPTADWQQRGEGAAVRTVRTAAAATVQAYRGGTVAIRLLAFAVVVFIGIWAIASGLATSLPGLVGIGAMAAGIYWVWRRLLAKKFATTDQRVWRN